MKRFLLIVSYSSLVIASGQTDQKTVVQAAAIAKVALPATKVQKNLLAPKVPTYEQVNGKNEKQQKNRSYFVKHEPRQELAITRDKLSLDDLKEGSKNQVVRNLYQKYERAVNYLQENRVYDKPQEDNVIIPNLEAWYKVTLRSGDSKPVGYFVARDYKNNVEVVIDSKTGKHQQPIPAGSLQWHNFKKRIGLAQ